MDLVLFGTSFRAAINLIVKSDGVKPKNARQCGFNPMTYKPNAVALTTAVTTGLETIDILTIFLKRSEAILAKEISLSLSMFRSSYVSRSTHCSTMTRYKSIMEKVYIYFKLLTLYFVRIPYVVVGLSARFSEV